MHPRMIAATISVTQLAVPVLRPCVCYVCVMGVGVRPAPRRRLGFETGSRGEAGSPLGWARHSGSPLGSPLAHMWAHRPHCSLPRGSPLGLAAGLFSKGDLRRLELHRLLQCRTQVGVVHHHSPVTAAAAEQLKALWRGGEGLGDSTIKRHAIGREREVEAATARATLDSHRDVSSIAKARGTGARLLAGQGLVRACRARGGVVSCVRRRLALMSE